MGDFKPDDATLAKLFGQNRAWKRQVDEQDEHFFKESAKEQSPKVVAELFPRFCPTYFGSRFCGSVAWTLGCRSRSS